MRAGALRGRARPDHLVHDGDVDRRGEEILGESALGEDRPSHVTDLDGGHQRCLFLVSPVLTLDLTMTSAPVGPGTAPLRSRRLRSRSDSTTSRFSTVTRTLPIWPAIRVPLNTRDGVAQAPIAPGERCFRSVPCDAPIPAKPWRFMVPANPFPFETPITSACSPGWNMSTVIRCPGVYEPEAPVR